MNENAKTRQEILEVLYKAREVQAGKLANDGVLFPSSRLGNAYLANSA